MRATALIAIMLAGFLVGCAEQEHAMRMQQIRAGVEKLDANKAACCRSYSDLTYLALGADSAHPYDHDDKLETLDLSSGRSFVKGFALQPNLQDGKWLLEIKSDLSGIIIPSSVIMQPSVSFLDENHKPIASYDPELSYEPHWWEGIRFFARVPIDNELRRARYVVVYADRRFLGGGIQWCGNQGGTAYMIGNVPVVVPASGVCHRVPFATTGNLSVKLLNLPY